MGSRNPRVCSCSFSPGKGFGGTGTVSDLLSPQGHNSCGEQAAVLEHLQGAAETNRAHSATKK